MVLSKSKIWKIPLQELWGERLTLVLLNPDILCFANSVDPDQLASGSALFVIKFMNLEQLIGSSNLTGWKLEVGMAS